MKQITGLSFSWIVKAAALVLILALPLVVFADNVQNDVVAGGNDTFTLGGSTTVNYRIAANSGDGETGCNATVGSPAVVTINAPAGVTASPSSLTFTSCGTDQPVVFTAAVADSYEITVSVSDSGPGSYNTNPAKFTLHVLAPPPPSDTTAPTIDCTVPEQSFWYAGNVTVNCTASDSSGLQNSADASFSLSTNVPDGTETASAATDSRQVCDIHNNCATAGPYTFMVDQKAPTVECAAAPTFLLNQAGATVSATVTDGGSGPAASPVSATADTSSVGANKTASVTGFDNVGNSAQANCSYNVTYAFQGFFEPVSNGVVNVAKAGQAIPLKWRLLDANGSPVTNLSSVTVTVASLSCTLGSTTDQLEEYASGSSGLQNLGDGYYQFNWKTPKTYASSCKTMKLNLGEGPDFFRTADFSFTK